MTESINSAIDTSAITLNIVDEPWGNTVTVYVSDLATGAYLGTREEYVVRGTGLPPECHEEGPPAASDGQVAAWKNGEWLLVQDWRGKSLYSTTDGTPIEIAKPGITPDDIGATDQPRPTPVHSWDGHAWVAAEDILANYQLEQARTTVEARVTAERAVADHAITPLQDAVDIGEATADEEAQLIEWKKYRVLLNRVDKQSGYPLTIDWPSRPKR